MSSDPAIAAAPDLSAADRPARPVPVSRRRLLVAGGAGLVLGAAGVEAGQHLSPSGSASAGAVAPGEMLMYEHGVLKRVLLVYQAALGRLVDDPPVATAAIRGGAEVIHDFIEGFHEALEEGYVFPALRAAGLLVPTVDTLLEQHARGRLVTQYLLAAATSRTAAADAGRAALSEAVTSFVRMYEPHEAREDTVVFPAYRALLHGGQVDEVGATFADLQRRQLGPDAFGSALDRVVALETSLGIDQLASFTPPLPG